MSKQKQYREKYDYDRWEKFAMWYTRQILRVFTIAGVLMIGIVKGCWLWLKDLLSKKEVPKKPDVPVDDKPHQRT
jgi:hypothetical protein